MPDDTPHKDGPATPPTQPDAVAEQADPSAEADTATLTSTGPTSPEAEQVEPDGQPAPTPAIPAPAKAGDDAASADVAAHATTTNGDAIANAPANDAVADAATDPPAGDATPANDAAGADAASADVTAHDTTYNPTANDAADAVANTTTADAATDPPAGDVTTANDAAANDADNQSAADVVAADDAAGGDASTVDGAAANNAADGASAANEAAASHATADHGAAANLATADAAGDGVGAADDGATNDAAKQTTTDDLATADDAAESAATSGDAAADKVTGDAGRDGGVDGGLITVSAEAGEDRPITAITDPVALPVPAHQVPAHQVPEHVRALQDQDPHKPDPLLDMEQRKLEAGVDKLSPFGRPGQPLGTGHPFVFGFTAALGVICAWLLVQAIISARQVIVLIVVSMFLAVGLNPAVERLQRARLPRGGAVGVVFLGLVLVFVGVGFAIVPPVTDGITDFIDHLPGYIQQLQENPRIKELDEKHQVLEKAQRAVTDPNFGQTALDGAVGVGKVVLGGIFSMLTVLILTLYFLGSLPTIKTFFYRLAPRSRRARVALLGDEILLRIGGYVAGTITVAFIAGTTAYIFLSVIGLKFALPLALVVAITALIPLVGATIGAVLACAVTFFEQGTVACIIAAIFFLVYQQIENYIIHPRVMKRAVDVQPAVTIIAALVGGTLLGIVGALLAIPTAAAIALIVREVVVPRQENL